LHPVVVTRANETQYVRIRRTAPPTLPDLIRAITIAHPFSCSAI
jgi:hypothetical protein